MRIGIDARFYGIMGKGLGRYTQQLVCHLEQIDTKNTYYIFLRPENFDVYEPKNNRFHKVKVDIPWYSFREQRVFPKILLKYRLDIVHFTHFNVPAFYGKPFVVTIHDLILFHFPTFRATMRSKIFYAVKYLAYRFVLRQAISRSRHIITVSKYTREDILRNFRVDPKKITVTYQAASIVSETKKNISESKTILSRYGILGKYFLYVGNAYPHKNLERLLVALSLVGEKSVQLVLVGKEDFFFRRIRNFSEQKGIRNIIFTGDVSDRELAYLYRGSVAYVFPSLYEGFGLPPLEAMAQGVPVLSSLKAALPEILGDAAEYFNPEDCEDIARAMREILQNKTFRENLVEKGYKRVRQFSWVRLAKDTQNIYTQAL